MSASDIHIVILAAGQGTRMKSVLPKVMHSIAGIPMIDYVLRAADGLRPTSVTVVIGHKAELVERHLQHRHKLRTVVQEPQLGTAHALQQDNRAVQSESFLWALSEIS